jgi:hypothetical protein
VEVLSCDWYVLRKTTFDYQHGDGHWSRQQRETYDRGDGATILLYSARHRTVLLTRQFRLPAYVNGHPDGRFSTVTAVMTSRAFDMPAASVPPRQSHGRHAAPDVLDVLRHPVLHVLNLDTTPATTSGNVPLAANSRASGAFLLCPGVCHLVALYTPVLRCPRTFSGRASVLLGRSVRTIRTVGAHRRRFHGRLRTGDAPTDGPRTSPQRPFVSA